MTLSGSRAPHGIDYGALDSFLGHFSSALRDLDRSERGVAPGKPGAPEAAASAATSLRIVSITPGSAIIELEPLREVVRIVVELRGGPDWLMVRR